MLPCSPWWEHTRGRKARLLGEAREFLDGRDDLENEGGGGNCRPDRKRQNRADRRAQHLEDESCIEDLDAYIDVRIARLELRHELSRCARADRSMKERYHCVIERITL